MNGSKLTIGTQVAWAWCIGFVLVALELLGGTVNVIFPGVWLFAFFCTVAYSWPVGLTAGCLACVAVEVVLGRSWTVLPLVPLVVWAAVGWRKLGDRTTLVNQAFPGAALGFTYAAATLLLANLRFSPPGLSMALGTMGLHLVKSTLAGLVGLPMLAGIADFLAERLDINLYHRRVYVAGGPNEG